jgi:osmotically inducible lipoprotein OsmB
MSNILRAFGVLAVAGTLAACGATPAERAATGALAGAAAADLTNNSVLTGALVGGAIGGIGPCVTNPNAPGCY